jgi:hypothetical protein
VNLQEAKEGMRVAYLPGHANGDIKHPDVEYGVVFSKNSVVVFVRFDAEVKRLGWYGATSQACSPEDIEPTGEMK